MEDVGHAPLSQAEVENIMSDKGLRKKYMERLRKCLKVNTKRKSAPPEVLAKWNREATSGNKNACKDLEGRCTVWRGLGGFVGPQGRYIVCACGASSVK
eukprot:15432358-Alexandrium_andersonii.AAC.1